MPLDLDAHQWNHECLAQQRTRLSSGIGANIRAHAAALLFLLAPSSDLLTVAAAEHERPEQTHAAPAEGHSPRHALTKEAAHGEHDVSGIILEAWKQQQPLRDAIEARGGIQQYFNSLMPEQQKSVFFEPDDPLCTACIDERTDEVLQGGRELHPIRSAGSDILDLKGMQKPMDPAYITSVAQKHNALNILEETDHARCGAGRAAYGRQYGLTAEALTAVDDVTIDAFVQEWTAKVLAERKRLLRDAAKPTRADALHAHHIAAEALRPSEAVHTADWITIDGTGRYDGSNAFFPRGFAISAPPLSDAEIANHVLLAIGIAMGKHGAGKLLTAEHPLTVTVIGDPSLPHRGAEQLRTLVSQAIAGLPAEQQSRIRIEEFTPRCAEQRE